MLPKIPSPLQIASHAWPGVEEDLLESLIVDREVVRREPSIDIPTGAEGPVMLLLSGLIGVGRLIDGTPRLPRTYVGGCVLNEERHLVEFLRDPGFTPPDDEPPISRTILPTRWIEIPDDAYLKAMESPAFLRATARHLKIEERVSNRMLTYHAAGNRETTLARVLIFLINQGGVLLQGKPCLRITQQQLSEVACLSLRHVNSTLRTLESENLIERFKGGFIVLDEAALLSRAGHGNATCFDHEHLAGHVDDI